MCFAVNPFFRDVPELQVFAENTTAVVTCPAYFGNPPAYTFMRWVKVNEDGSQAVIQNNSRFTAENERLTIRNIRLEENGTIYQCQLIKLPSHILIRTITVEVRPHAEREGNHWTRETTNATTHAGSHSDPPSNMEETE